MRELLYNAAEAFQRGRTLLEQGQTKAALDAFDEALRDLHAVKPQRQRNILLAQVYLLKYQAAPKPLSKRAVHDLHMGYSYARTTQEPSVRDLAEQLWRTHLHSQENAREIPTVAHS